MRTPRSVSDSLRWIVPAILTLAVSAQGASLTERWVHSTLPDDQTVSRWNQIQGLHALVLELDGLTAEDLAHLSRLKHVTHLTLETSSPMDFQDTGVLEGFKTLALRQPTVWVPTNLPLISSDDIALVNQIPFEAIRLRFNWYPDTADMKRLAEFRLPVSLEFNAQAWPRMDDREMFDAMPLTTLVSMSGDYWPWYTQMDLFNMVRQPLGITVRDMLPADDQLEYLHNIKRLQVLTVDTEFDPEPASLWNRLNLTATLHWKARGFVPEEASLKAFASHSSGAHALTVMFDQQLSVEEMARLNRTDIKTVWQHSAPFAAQ